MSKITVAYWSGTGNTEAMAEAVGEGIKAAGKECAVVSISDISASDLEGETSFALGCPAMGAEVLEEGEMEPFVEEVEKFAKGKNIALFGSYGWGDGEWMREWEKRVTDAGAKLTNESVIVNDSPDEDAVTACNGLGKIVAVL